MKTCRRSVVAQRWTVCVRCLFFSSVQKPYGRAGVKLAAYRIWKLCRFIQTHTTGGISSFSSCLNSDQLEEQLEV